MADILTFGDQLRVEGINFKGFGILPKYVMLDPDLTIEAKTIYAYFCSFAGNGNTTFPGREKILTDLPMSKNVYYKHFHLLTEQGYLTVIQNKANNSHFARNIYTLVSNPKKFQDKPEDPSKNQIYSRIRFDGLKATGFGIIPKAVMLDPRLPVKAKGIYAYFCSFTGSGNSAFPTKENILFHLGITHNTYQKFYKLLVALNYIIAVQRHVDGRLSVNDYYLTNTPDTAKAATKTVLSISNKQDTKIRDTETGKEEIQDTKISDTDIDEAEIQDTKISDTDIDEAEIQDTKIEDTDAGKEKIQDTKIEDTKKQDTKKHDTNNTSSIKTNSIYNQSLSQQTMQSEENERTSELDSANSLDDDEFLNAVDKILNIKALPYQFCQDEFLTTQIVHWMTNWEILYPHGFNDDLRQRVYNLFNHALIKMLTAKRAMTLKGSIVTYAKVVDYLNQLAVFDYYVDISEFMEPAMENYIRGAKKSEIQNPTYYMMACIWDAMQTGNISLYEQLLRDGYGT